jgi:RNase P subunit RPR2
VTTKNEDEYFAREEAEKLHRLHVEKLRAISKKDAAEQKKLHHMKCGHCGYDLVTVRWRSVDVEKCFRCGSILLEQGELEKLAGKEEKGQFMSSFLELFRSK